MLKKISKLAALLFSIISLASSVLAQEKNLSIKDSNFTLEDKSCHDVDQSYQRMNNSGRWSTDSFWIYPNGKNKLASRVVYIDRRVFTFSNDAWTNAGRLPLRLTFDTKSNLPIFSDCHFQGIQTVAGEPAFFYKANWQKGGLTAAIELWISKASGKFVRNILHYRKRPDWFEVSNVLQTMDYDRSHAVAPWDLQPPSSGSRN